MSTLEYSAVTEDELLSRPVQRRLTPLEASAATGVIVASLVALALMTGVISKPQPQPQPAASSARERIIPASTATPVPPSTPAARLPLDLAAPMLTIADTMEQVPTTLPPPTIQAMRPMPPDGKSLDEATSKPRAAPRKSRKIASDKSRRVMASRKSHRKTREQVMAELARAKRDGSYQAALDTYR